MTAVLVAVDKLDAREAVRAHPEIDWTDVTVVPLYPAVVPSLHGPTRIYRTLLATIEAQIDFRVFRLFKTTAPWCAVTEL